MVFVRVRIRPVDSDDPAMLRQHPPTVARALRLLVSSARRQSTISCQSCPAPSSPPVTIRPAPSMINLDIRQQYEIQQQKLLGAHFAASPPLLRTRPLDSHRAINIPPPTPPASWRTQLVRTSCTSTPNVSRCALVEDVSRGIKDLKPARLPAKSASVNGDARDKLLDEIATGRVSLKHVDTDKLLLEKECNNYQLTGLAAALARALTQRREKLHVESDDEDRDERDEEWNL